ncbi:NRP1 isoform 13, partial [Pan troglodytes]
PTAGPTTPNGNLVDECDDDQANCHSGTGDDFQLTGGTTVLATEKPTVIDSTIQSARLEVSTLNLSLHNPPQQKALI